jgi:hypothetical protein
MNSCPSLGTVTVRWPAIPTSHLFTLPSSQFTLENEFVLSTAAGTVSLNEINSSPWLPSPAR